MYNDQKNSILEKNGIFLVFIFW